MCSDTERVPAILGQILKLEAQLPARSLTENATNLPRNSLHRGPAVSGMSWLIAKCVDSSSHVLKDLSVERYYKTAGSALQLFDEAATVAVATTELIHLQKTATGVPWYVLHIPSYW